MLSCLSWFKRKVQRNQSVKNSQSLSRNLRSPHFYTHILSFHPESNRINDPFMIVSKWIPFQISNKLSQWMRWYYDCDSWNCPLITLMTFRMWSIWLWNRYPNNLKRCQNMTYVPLRRKKGQVVVNFALAQLAKLLNFQGQCNTFAKTKHTNCYSLSDDERGSLSHWYWRNIFMI